VDGITHEYDAAMLAFANTRDFGGGMQICPAADPTDGLVDVTVVADIGRIELLRFFRLVFDGRHLRHPKVHTHRGMTITVECDELALWGDGEPLDAAPVSCRAVSGAIQLARRAQ
jgi:diacylglycerol kinase (ATP)